MGFCGFGRSVRALRVLALCGGGLLGGCSAAPLAVGSGSGAATGAGSAGSTASGASAASGAASTGTGAASGTASGASSSGAASGATTSSAASGSAQSGGGASGTTVTSGTAGGGTGAASGSVVSSGSVVASGSVVGSGSIVASGAPPGSASGTWSSGSATAGSAAAGATSGGAASGSASSGIVSSGSASSGAPACDALPAAYAIELTDPVGCGNLVPAAIECISQAGCTATLRPLTPAKPGISGTVNLTVGAGGVTGFTNASLTLGNVMRTGCTGQYNGPSGTLTIDCGGMGSAQSCVVALHRTGTCP